MIGLGIKPLARARKKRHNESFLVRSRPCPWCHWCHTLPRATRRRSGGKLPARQVQVVSRYRRYPYQYHNIPAGCDVLGVVGVLALAILTIITQYTNGLLLLNPAALWLATCKPCRGAGNGGRGIRSSPFSVSVLGPVSSRKGAEHGHCGLWDRQGHPVAGFHHGLYFYLSH